jgi:hypothetical protein
MANGVDLSTLLEQLDRLSDKPHEYNSLIAKLIRSLSEQTLGNLLRWQGGICYSFDPTRQKEISIDRSTISAGTYGKGISDRYLRVDGIPSAGSQGFLVPRAGLITGLWAKSRSMGSWSIEIRKNGIPITLVSVPVISSFGIDDSLDIDVERGDWLQFYLHGQNVEHPIAALELAWRTN